MTDLPPAVQVAVVRDLENRVRIAKVAANRAVLNTVSVGGSTGAVLLDGTRLGRAGVQDELLAFVEAPAAFLEWVRVAHPTEVFEAVRPAFQERVLGEAKKSGELLPGVGVAPGEPYVTYSTYKTPPAHLWIELLEVRDGVR